ncbi:unnamed protein product [Moneuplotes crassus]|uniref:Uncharacterized protein n=2 Tax=Euplotes crassus TaxID=5936 RepID=A0AAD2D9A3_EUPCR|nr:unnamed protein product [Moneuplotes crassus]
MWRFNRIRSVSINFSKSYVGLNNALGVKPVRWFLNKHAEAYNGLNESEEDSKENISSDSDQYESDPELNSKIEESFSHLGFGSGVWSNITEYDSTHEETSDAEQTSEYEDLEKFERNKTEHEKEEFVAKPEKTNHFADLLSQRIKEIETEQHDKFEDFQKPKQETVTPGIFDNISEEKVTEEPKQELEDVLEENSEEMEEEFEAMLQILEDQTIYSNKLAHEMFGDSETYLGPKGGDLQTTREDFARSNLDPHTEAGRLELKEYIESTIKDLDKYSTTRTDIGHLINYLMMIREVPDFVFQHIDENLLEVMNSPFASNVYTRALVNSQNPKMAKKYLKNLLDYILANEDNQPQTDAIGKLTLIITKYKLMLVTKSYRNNRAAFNAIKRQLIPSKSRKTHKNTTKVPQCQLDNVRNEIHASYTGERSMLISRLVNQIKHNKIVDKAFIQKTLDIISEFLPNLDLKCTFIVKNFLASFEQTHRAQYKSLFGPLKSHLASLSTAEELKTQKGTYLTPRILESMQENRQKYTLLKYMRSFKTVKMNNEDFKRGVVLLTHCFDRCLEDEQLAQELGYVVPLIADQFKPVRKIDQKRLDALIKRESEIFKAVDYDAQEEIDESKMDLKLKEIFRSIKD